METIVKGETNIKRTVSKTGFTHPGIGCTAATLKTCRDAILKGISPWADYFEGLRRTTYSRLDKKLAMVERITNDDEIYLFAQDAQCAWTHAVIYAVSGDDAYLKIPLAIFEHYAAVKNFFPKPFCDCHIKLGKYVYTLCAALDILRTVTGETLVAAVAENCTAPICHKALYYNGYFMNQHTYAIIGVLAHAVLTDDRALYEQMVEWSMVNASSNSWARSGAIASQMRIVEPEANLQLVEMGRDQPHAAGNIDNLLMMTRTMELQGTLVDSVTGQVSKQGVPPSRFLDDRLFKCAALYMQYNLGHDIKWFPTYAETESERNIAADAQLDEYVKAYYSREGNVLYMAPSFSGRGNLIMNGVAAAYFACPKDLLEKEEYCYIKKAYEEFLPFHVQRARSGEFIETLHNYAFDFWISACTPFSAPDENKARRVLAPVVEIYESDYDLSCFANVSCALSLAAKKQRGAVLAKIDECRQSFCFQSDGGVFEISACSDGVARITLFDAEGHTLFGTEYLCDTKGIAQAFVFKLPKGLCKMEIDSLGAKRTEFFSLRKLSDMELPQTEADYMRKGERRQDITEYRVLKISGRNKVVKENIHIFTSDDDAFAFALRGYDENEEYEQKSLQSLKEAMRCGDAAQVWAAVKSLRPLNPRLDDGSIAFDKVCTSSVGSDISKYTDSSNLTFTSIYDDERAVKFDFGDGFAFCAERFAVGERSGFPSRAANVMFSASNDGKSWTALTDMTKKMCGMQFLTSKSSEPYRYIKVHMQKTADWPICFDLGEIRMFGRRISK
ncbi:MAG: hypothetical protein Q4C12_03900 [Clostridia bacterium]|nr:hypothetical protein [Clostridia bacterium]